MKPAVAAFDAIAPDFDRRFGSWLSVAAQRAAVRRELLRAFPPGAHVLEIGGGTGEDAAWLAARGRRVTLTNASPAMITVARQKLRPFNTQAASHVLAAEALADWGGSRCGPPGTGAGRLDDGIAHGFAGAFSNFAALNCVADLRPVARGLARLLHPSAPALLVLFGTASPVEVLLQLLRREPRAALRRRSRADVPARLGGRDFTVRYHRASDIAAAFSPWFRLEQRRGIGVFVPPSLAEPWISRHPRLLGLLERLDRATAHRLAKLGDHVLYRLVRTSAPVSASASPATTHAATLPANA